MQSVAPQFIDTHAHLTARDFDDDRDEMIARAHAAGISHIITIGAGYGIQSAHDALICAERHESVFAAVALHPNDAGIPCDRAFLSPFLSHAKVVAIGETGLDFYRSADTRINQEQWFRYHIETALEAGLPLIIHSREAGSECLRILLEYPVARIGGVFHCFAEDAAFAQRLRTLNFLISIPGNITFKSAEKFRTAVKEIPLDQIMLETDAPFLAPQPFRGKRCESAMMVETAKVVAGLKNLTLAAIAEATSANARRLFKFC